MRRKNRSKERRRVLAQEKRDKKAKSEEITDKGRQ